MPETHILRVPRTDDADNYVLVQVTSSGRKELDLKLVATDGEAPYVVQLKQGKVSSLKDKKHPCSENEWEKILADVLLDRQSDPEIEAAAQVSAEQNVTLIVRRSISGIKQRIGTINLKYDEDEGIELFDWCATSIEAKERIKEDLVTATSKVEGLESAVKELKDQLEELIEAKKSNETELLEKFRDLLNEKKVKIREQQRLLMANDVDVDGGTLPVKQSQSQPARDVLKTTKAHVPKQSRKSKRKAATPEPEPEPSPPAEIPESDDELERMEVDKKHGEEDSENDDTTEDGDADATASEDEDADDAPAPGSKRVTRKDIEKPPSANTRHASQTQPDEPPPPRKLPFNQKKPAAKRDPEPEGSETDSDDEL